MQREDTFFVPLFMSFSSSITVVTVVRIDVIIKKMTLLERKHSDMQSTFAEYNIVG